MDKPKTPFWIVWPAPPAFATSRSPDGSGLFGSLDRSELQFICDVLNSKEQPALTRKLTQLVDLWRRSGPNLHLMVDSLERSNPQLRRAVTEAVTANWLPSPAGSAWWAPVPHVEMGQDNRPTPDSWAAVLFALLTLNPEWHKLLGPCRQCNRYYIQGRKSNDTYCSQKCGHTATTLAARKRERTDKLKRARVAAQKWRTARTRDDWKRFVRNQEPDLTANFLTRAVKNGELEPPEKRKTNEHLSL
jgi:hypothetical protein